MNTKTFKVNGYSPEFLHKNSKVQWSVLYNDWCIKVPYGEDRQVIDGLEFTAVSEIVDYKHPTIKYNVTLFVGKLSETFEYSMGYAIGGIPKVVDLLWCLISDAEIGDGTYREFCDEFGYNFTGKEYYNTYLACQETGRKLRYLLGNHYHTVVDYIRSLDL